MSRADQSCMLRRSLLLSVLALLMSACSKVAYINEPVPPEHIKSDVAWPFHLSTWERPDRAPELLVLLAFSGGGARASAMAYGALLELSATAVRTSRGDRTLLEEIDVISSVSGGSFVSAYFGLHGKHMFDNFEHDVLQRNLESDILKWLARPKHWTLNSHRFGRSDRIAEYLDETLFDGATLGDLDNPHSPTIIINATDIGTGSRFAFTRPYFRLLCSNFDRYPLSRAVAASSAVPGLASPIALANHTHLCINTLPAWVNEGTIDPSTTNLTLAKRSIREYTDVTRRPWLHLVDGGVSDNLGLRPFYAAAEIEEDARQLFARFGHGNVRHVLLISVNASLTYQREWSKRSQTPKATQVLSAISSIQMERYNADSVQLVRDSYEQWQRDMTADGLTASFNFVEVNIPSVPNPSERAYLNAIPTNFNLSEEQVSRLISATRQSLRNAPEFKRFLADNGANSPHHKP